MPVPPEETPRGEFSKRFEIVVGPRVVFPATFKEPCMEAVFATLRFAAPTPAVNLLYALKLLAAPNVAISEGMFGTFGMLFLKL